MPLHASLGNKVNKEKERERDREREEGKREERKRERGKVIIPHRVVMIKLII